MHFIFSLPDWKKHLLFLLTTIVVSLIVNVLFLEANLVGPIFFLAFFISIAYLLILFRNPRIGLITVVFIGFLSDFLGREIISLPYANIMEVLLLVTLIACVCIYPADDRKLINNDLSFLFLSWFILSVFQIVNPERPNIEGALGELRTIAVYPLFVTLIAFMTIKTNDNLNFILRLFLILSLFACLGGIKQQHFGLSTAEQAFLDDGGATTHLLWGRLRVFSFYDAARFGCLMAQFAIISSILAFGNFKVWKRILFLVLTGLFIYGMLLSGTRTALIVIVAGAFFAILASKNFKIFIWGGLFMLLFLSFLKFTHIGNGNYEIYRLRSAVNPEDPSLNVRFTSQQALSTYMKGRPFGAGLGVIGYYGHKYNSDKFPSTIEPDSFWVKVWVMYGVIGMIIWFGIYMYIFGKCFGIIWNIKDDRLRFKLIALASSSFGIFFCSYGNEIINTVPSLFVVAVSLVIVYRGPHLDKEISLSLTSKK